MITGDFPSHEVWKQSREWNLAHSKMMSDLVSDVFPDKLILPSVGNHESFPTNRFVIIITGVRPEDNICKVHTANVYRELQGLYGEIGVRGFQFYGDCMYARNPCYFEISTLLYAF